MAVEMESQIQSGGGHDEGANLGEFIRVSRRIHSCISANSFMYLGEFIHVSRRIHSCTSMRSPVVSRPTNCMPFASSFGTYSMFTS